MIEKGMKKIWPYKNHLRHGLIKSRQLDFSKRQMALYRKQGHGLITEVIRYYNYNNTVLQHHCPQKL